MHVVPFHFLEVPALYRCNQMCVFTLFFPEVCFGSMFFAIMPSFKAMFLFHRFRSDNVECGGSVTRLVRESQPNRFLNVRCVAYAFLVHFTSLIVDR